MKERSLVALLATFFLVVACSTGGGATGTPASPGETMGETPTEVATAPAPGGDPNDLLAIVKARGTIRMSTDPQYPPQSELTPEGTYEGFDIDVGTEIANRLGVEIAFETPDWDVLTAGSWSERWDFSVGSMTITSEREKVLTFTEPYYFTPAQMAASTSSGITTLDGLAGKTICVGEATTYLQWLDGTLDFGTETPQTDPPEGATATTLDTDRLCAEAWKAGRSEFEGWLSSSTTVEQAIEEGLPLVAVGDPVFFEPLAVAVDKSGPPHAEFIAEVDRILDEMRTDGTLKELSEKWFDKDLTEKQG
jgi:polar amino acid transport system substrate-binding protein